MIVDFEEEEDDDEDEEDWGLLLVLIDSSEMNESIFTPADAAAARVKGGTGLVCGVSRESFSVNDGITSVEGFELFNLFRERRLYELQVESVDGGRTATGLIT